MSNAARSFAGYPLAQLTLVRFLEFVREPEVLFWALAFPVLLAAGLGAAFQDHGPEVVKVAALRASLAQRLQQEKSLDVVRLPRAQAEAALRAGEVALVADLDTSGGVVYRYDDTNPEGRMARLLAGNAVEKGREGVNLAASRDRIMHEPGSRYIDFLLPGLLGMSLMGTSVWGTGFAIVDARRRKLLKRLMATPMPRASYLLSFVISQFLILAAGIAALAGFGVLAFRVPMRGSVPGLILLCVLGSLCFSAIGLLIAARTETIEGASGMMNMVMLPMWVCSGVFFSTQRFPDVLQPFLRALPLTALIDALRLNMLRGAGLTETMPEVLWLTAFFAACFCL
ncbi:MAG TPA: ABC transporter permease, partial [Bryobacteraceae bacterium]|nr:ABC transporter permease [Bryobacteraceae bacterium]